MDKDNTPQKIDSIPETVIPADQPTVSIAIPTKKKQTKLLALVLVAAVIILSGVGYVLLKDKDKSSKTSEPSATEQITTPLEEVSKSYQYPAASKTFAQNEEDMFQLVTDTDVYLERNKFQFESYVHWHDWFFFYTKEYDKTTQQEVNRTTSIHAFNFKTKEYIKVGDITPANGATELFQVEAHDKYLYLGFDVYKLKGNIYRCELDETQGCKNITLVYEGTGSFTYINENLIYLEEYIGDGGYFAGSLYSYDLKTSTKTLITSYENYNGYGTMAIGQSSDGTSWSYEQTGDKNVQNGEILSKIYAHNANGTQTASFTDLPIKDAKIAYKGDAHPERLYFANKTNEAYFDIETKKFSEVVPLDTFPTENKPEQSLADKLELPEGYDILPMNSDDKQRTSHF